MTKFIMFLIVSNLVFPLSTAFSQEMSLTAEKGLFKFPFFDDQTPVWQYNGQIPGPVLRANTGKTLTVRLNNKLEEPVTQKTNF